MIKLLKVLSVLLLAGSIWLILGCRDQAATKENVLDKKEVQDQSLNVEFNIKLKDLKLYVKKSDQLPTILKIDETIINPLDKYETYFNKKKKYAIQYQHEAEILWIKKNMKNEVQISFLCLDTTPINGEEVKVDNLKIIKSPDLAEGSNRFSYWLTTDNYIVEFVEINKEKNPTKFYIELIKGSSVVEKKESKI